MPWSSDDFKKWFAAERDINGAYRHLTLAEINENREAGLAALTTLAEEAHRDARERLNELVGISLDPSTAGVGAPPKLLKYPDDLATSTLQGYLGELFAGLIAENFEPHDQAWIVPAFLFRNHPAAAQALDRRQQLGGPATPIPGRTGDDALAFVRDTEGQITAWLFGEAKCTHDHNSTLINDGHEQLSSDIYRPVDLTALIDILDGAPDLESDGWVDALRLLFLASPTNAPPRFDMLVYVCGRHPVQNSTWIPPTVASSHYTGGRDLEAVEVHLTEFDAVLVAAYPQHKVSR